MEQNEIDQIRSSILKQCGSKVMIKLDRGRNKIDIERGVIKEAYPSVFTILVDEKEEDRPVSGDDRQDRSRSKRTGSPAN